MDILEDNVAHPPQSALHAPLVGLVASATKRPRLQFRVPKTKQPREHERDLEKQGQEQKSEAWKVDVRLRLTDRAVPAHVGDAARDEEAGADRWREQSDATTTRR